MKKIVLTICCCFICICSSACGNTGESSNSEEKQTEPNVLSVESESSPDNTVKTTTTTTITTTVSTPTTTTTSKKTIEDVCDEVFDSVKSDNIEWKLTVEDEYVGYIYKPGIREIAERCIPAWGNYSVDSFEIWLTLKNSCKDTTKMIDELFATEGYPEITVTLYVLDDTMCDGFPGEGEDYYYLMKCSNGLCYYDITDQ